MKGERVGLIASLVMQKLFPVQKPEAGHGEFVSRRFTPIPATDVLRVLQRVADGTAENISFSGDMMFTIFADGWQIVCMDDCGIVDGIYSATAPNGTVAVMEDWDVAVEPTELLTMAENDAIIRRLNEQ